jgi:sRNA-binding regulator protein Hfq
LFLLALVLVAHTAKADTIHLKNGSVLKGKVTSFADDQFVIMLDTGSGRYLSRAMVYIGDVARIEFDSAATATLESPARDTTASIDPPRTNTSRDTEPRDNPPNNPTMRNTQPVEQPARDTSIDTKPVPPPAREPVIEQPEKPAVSTERPNVSVVPTSELPDAERGARKPAAPGRTATVDVFGKRDWTSTGLIVKRGDRVRITATGTVTIDTVTARTSGPEGVADLVDGKKLMGDHPTAALIGVIGADNDDFIFIGRQAEFTATRDGLLFLSVNEGSLADNTGSFKAVIEVQSQRR